MKIKLLTLLMLIPLLVGCSETVTHTSFMMDTVITYSITAENAEALVTECDAVTASLEQAMSAHIETSEVARFNNGTHKNGELSEDTAKVLRIALTVSELTNGAYDITVAPLVTLWDTAHPDDGWTPPSANEISASLPYIGYDSLTLSDNSLTRASEAIKIDLGGIAKGYALGKCAEYLALGDAVGTISFGGNIAVAGKKADGSEWRVGVKSPDDPSSLCGVLSIPSGIVAVSGGYERYAEYNGVRYHHIIDPHTGYPADSDLASAAVWVKDTDACSGAYADALSTALFVMGSDAALEFYNETKNYGFGAGAFEAVLIKKDGGILLTYGLEGRFVPNE